MDRPQIIDPPPTIAAPARRSFLRKVAAVAIGTIAMMIPGAAGLAVLLDPLRRRKNASGFIPITTLDALPSDGAPRKFQVITDRSDAWTGSPKTPVGAVYLQRGSDSTGVVAFNVRCPHAGCFVDALPPGQGFHCPCHNSRFLPDGSVEAGSPSPRGLDSLEIDPIALKDGIVQVRFENFVAGIPEKIARS